MSDNKIRVSDLVNSYRRSKAHWYLFPRAAYINEKNVRELHETLKLFRDYQWMRVADLIQPELALAGPIDPNAFVLRKWTQDVQREIQALMVERGLIRPRRRAGGRVADYLANLRNHWNLLKKFGFAYVNRLGHLFISDAGQAFLDSSERQWPEIFEQQLIRLQFWNPSLVPASSVSPGYIDRNAVIKKYREFQIFPYLFTLRLLLEVPREGISQLEFVLFVDTSHGSDDLAGARANIIAFRALSHEQQRKVRRVARVTMPHLINASVTMGMFGYTPTIQAKEGRLFLRDRRRAEKILANYWGRLRHVNYTSFTDWFSRMGRVEEGPTAREAITYYAELGRASAAKELLNVVDDVTEKADLHDELSRLLSERLIEDTLEKSPHHLEAGLTLVPNGRQYSTDVTRIDLLAKDVHGRYVIVELKRGRTEDEVVGQTLRYVGWVRENLSPGQPVRGIIVVSDDRITEKLKYAVKGAQAISPNALLLKHMPVQVKAQMKDIS